MSGFFETMLRPDREEDPLRAEIAQAANLLQIGEFQLLQLAYKAWHNREMSGAVSDAIFRSYMLRSEVPAWARHYARRVIELAARDDLDDRDPRYHVYDAEYYKALPLGARRLAVAVMCLAFFVVGGLAVGHLAPVESSSLLPPYFDDRQLDPSDDSPSMPR